MGDLTYYSGEKRSGWFMDIGGEFTFMGYTLPEAVARLYRFYLEV